TRAVAAMGFDLGPMHLIALPNAADLHNVIVCTLCSCYPRNLLGLPPDWYKTRAYRSRAVREPRAVLAEFGLDLPDSTTI
ncbi:MAG: nitrile hydratase subunit alpha, partial [Paracoccaceae bacterium]|nr:nitrile hydratase subunit alpha [Paracoccaceae bacterium]